VKREEKPLGKHRKRAWERGSKGRKEGVERWGGRKDNQKEPSRRKVRSQPHGCAPKWLLGYISNEGKALKGGLSGREEPSVEKGNLSALQPSMHNNWTGMEGGLQVCARGEKTGSGKEGREAQKRSSRFWATSRS